MPRKTRGSVNSDKCRFTICVPVKDKSVVQWCEAQDNLSISLRMLIKAEVAKNGYSDVLCREVIQGARRGRPSLTDMEMREADYEEESVVEEPAKKTVSEKKPKSPKVEKKVSKPTSPKTEEMSDDDLENLILSKPSKGASSDADMLDDDGFIDDPSVLLGLG